MTVKDLITELQKLPPTLDVKMENCTEQGLYYVDVVVKTREDQNGKPCAEYCCLEEDC